jgi:hypothetical protein
MNLKSCARIASLLISGAALVSACSSSRPTGGVRQDCYPNGTCNAGLSCFSNICVDATDGGSGVGGRSGAAGAGGIGNGGTAGGHAGAGGASSGGSGGSGASGASGGSGGLGVGGSSGGGSSANCQALTTYGTPTLIASSEIAENLTDTIGDQRLVWQGQLNALAMPDILDVELYNAPPFGATIAPMANIDLSGQSQYETCGACVFVLTQVGMDGSAQQVYLATAGTLTITAVSPNITGMMSNVTFQHVTIDPNTTISTRVDNCVTSVTSASFNTMVVNMAASP